MRKKLKTLNNKRFCVVGRVRKMRTPDDGIPHACIVNVRRKDTGETLTNHVWAEGNWIQTENIDVGDTIQFYGLICKYRKFSKLRKKPVFNYGFSQIRNVKKINHESI